MTGDLRDLYRQVCFGVKRRLDKDQRRDQIGMIYSQVKRGNPAAAPPHDCCRSSIEFDKQFGGIFAVPVKVCNRLVVRIAEAPAIVGNDPMPA